MGFEIMLYVRLFIAVVVGIPTAPLFLYAISIFGVGFILLPAGLCILAFALPLQDEDGIEMGVEALKFFGFIVASPVIFWSLYVKGRNPFVEMGL